MLFFTVWLGKENRGEKILFQAHNFYPPKSRGKSKRKSAFTALLRKYSLPPTLIHDLMTLSLTPPDDFLLTNHPYHFFASSHLTFSNVQWSRFSSLSLSLSLSLNLTWMWVECCVNFLTTFFLVTKSFAQLNLYVHYCNFYIIIIKIIIKLYIYDVVNFILFNEYK